MEAVTIYAGGLFWWCCLVFLASVVIGVLATLFMAAASQ